MRIFCLKVTLAEIKTYRRVTSTHFKATRKIMVGLAKENKEVQEKQIDTKRTDSGPLIGCADESVY